MVPRLCDSATKTTAVFVGSWAAITLAAPAESSATAWARGLWRLRSRSPFGEASEAGGVRSPSRKQKCDARGNPDYDGAGQRVEEEVVAGRDDDE